MKKSFTLIFLWTCLLLLSSYNNTISAQDSNDPPTNKFVQLYVEGISSIPEAKNIDAFLRAQEGVLMSRTDPNSRILFCIFSEKAAIEENTFITWLNDLGFQISCFREGIHGVDKVYSREDGLCN